MSVTRKSPGTSSSDVAVRTEENESVSLRSEASDSVGQQEEQASLLLEASEMTSNIECELRAS